ncbi:unnamed protein product [Knipowitschia caucasica]
MDLWKMQLFLVTFLWLVQLDVGVGFSEEDGEVSAEEWQDAAVDPGLTAAVEALVKRSKALRFYGLMGKRSGAANEKPIKVDRKKKGEMFVGLMGRSVSEHLPRTRPSPASDSPEKSQKQGSQEEWLRIIY